MWSWEQCGETGVVLLGFLTLAVSVGNLSTRGLQVHNTQENSLLILLKYTDDLQLLSSSVFRCSLCVVVVVLLVV